MDEIMIIFLHTKLQEVNVPHEFDGDVIYYPNYEVAECQIIWNEDSNAYSLCWKFLEMRVTIESLEIVTNTLKGYHGRDTTKNRYIINLDYARYTDTHTLFIERLLRSLEGLKIVHEYNNFIEVKCTDKIATILEDAREKEMLGCSMRGTMFMNAGVWAEKNKL